MKKLLIIAVALLFIPYAALADMTALDNNEMDSINGQIGIDLSAAAGDLDIAVNLEGEAAILGLININGSGNLHLINDINNSTGQSISLSILSGGRIIGADLDLSGLQLSGGVSNLSLDAMGLPLFISHLNGGISLNRCKVTAGIGL